MTGIAIITAGREDAYQDYLQSVKGGHDPAEFSFGRYTAGEHCQWCQHNQLACAPDSFTVGPGFEE